MWLLSLFYRLRLIWLIIGLDDTILYHLHQGDELIKCYQIGLEVVYEVSNLGRITLQRAHNRFKVLGVNAASLLLVKEVKDFSQVLHLIVSELLCLQLRLRVWNRWL